MQRILVADDDAAIRGVVRDLLEDEGYDVSEAENGNGVLAALARPVGDRPDLVVMDVRMPDKSGIDVLREAASTVKAGSGIQLPFIIMTAFGTSNVAIEAIQLGAYDYLTKPFDLDHVLLTVQRFFERQQLSDQVQTLQVRLGEGPRVDDPVLPGRASELVERRLDRGGPGLLGTDVEQVCAAGCVCVRIAKLYAFASAGAGAASAGMASVVPGAGCCDCR